MFSFTFKIYDFGSSVVLFKTSFSSNSLSGLQSFRDFLFELQEFFFALISIL